jgi:predicted RNA binding protein YcfA (HicA-like mRNA interferase family)
MNISSLDSNSILKASVNNVGDELSAGNQSRSQKKIEDINNIIQSNLALQQNTGANITSEIGLKSVVLSNEFNSLMNKIKKQEYLDSREMLIQILIKFAVKKADHLNAELKNIGIKSCRLSEVFLLLNISVGLWYYELNNINQDISSIKESDFFFLPNQFTSTKLNNTLGSMVFNPLEKNVKNHLYAYLINAFLTAPQKSTLAWDEFIKQNTIIALIDDLLTTSQAIKELIYHPNFHKLCSYNVFCFIDSFKESEHTESKFIDILLEGFKFAVRSYNFYNNFIFSKSVQSNPDPETKDTTDKSTISEEAIDKIVCDLYWFDINKYESFIQEIQLNQQNESKLSEVFINELFNVIRINNQSAHDLYKAKQGLLSYKSWSEKIFNLTPPFEESKFKFKSRLKFQNHLIRYFGFSYQQMFSLFMSKVPHGFPYDPGRDLFTLEIIKYYLSFNKAEKFVIKRNTIKKYYDFMNIFLGYDCLTICNQFASCFNNDFNWLQRIKCFLAIEDWCRKIRNFSKQLLIHNEELQKYLENASEDEKTHLEREYDLVKSHFMLPIFILNSLSRMEELHKELKIVDPKKEGVDVTRREPTHYTYLDEINQFFVDDRYFQSHRLHTTQIPPQKETAQKDVQEPEHQPKAECQSLGSSHEGSVSSTLEDKAEESEPQKPSVQSPVSSPKPAEKSTDVDVSQILKPSAVKPYIPPLAISPSTSADPYGEKDVSFSRGMKVRKLIKELKELGFDFNRQAGSHAIFKLNNQQVVVPTSNDTLPRGTLESIESRVNEIVNQKQKTIQTT